jgi:hypothetical protein
MGIPADFWGTDTVYFDLVGKPSDSERAYSHPVVDFSDAVREAEDDAVEPVGASPEGGPD